MQISRTSGLAPLLTAGLLSLLLTLSCLRPAAATPLLASAPATGKTLTNNGGGNAVVEVRGHTSYGKDPSQGPGWFYYYWPSHDTTDCGNSFCAQGTATVGYYRHLAVSGLGPAGDPRQVAYWGNERIYRGSNLEIANGDPQVYQLFFDADEVERRWWPNAGFQTNLTVQYKLGVWQGGTGDPADWVVTTASGGF